MVTSAYCESSLREREHETRPHSEFDALFAEAYPFLLAWCRKHVDRRLGDPEDFVHQAYFRCRNCWSPARPSAGRESAYFFQALRWVVFAEVARRGRRPLEPLVEERASASAAPLESLIAVETLGRLSRRQREACLGRMAGRTDERVAAELGLKPATLAVHLSRAAAVLRAEMGMRE